MNVKHVDNQAFTGYVDKSVVKYVNRCVSDECKAISKSATNRGVQVDESKLESVVNLGNSLINNLETYMKPLHKNTVLKILKDKYGTYEITISNGKEYIGFSSIYNKAMKIPQMINDKLCNIQSPFSNRGILNEGMFFLERFHNFTKNLLKLDKAQIDENLFIQKFEKAKEKASNFWFFGNSRTQKLAEEIDNMSYEFGTESSINWGKEVIKARFDTLKKDKLEKQNHQKQKEIERRNRIIVKRLLNNQ